MSIKELNKTFKADVLPRGGLRGLFAVLKALYTFIVNNAAELEALKKEIEAIKAAQKK